MPPAERTLAAKKIKELLFRVQQYIQISIKQHYVPEKDIVQKLVHSKLHIWLLSRYVADCHTSFVDLEKYD
jgi:hypothetical protein